MRLLLILTILTGAISLFAQCEPSAGVRDTLEKISADGSGIPYTPAERVRRREMYRAALDQHPHDYFLLRAMSFTFEKKPDALAWIRGLASLQKEQPAYQLMHAMILEGRNSAEAERMMRDLRSRHPEWTRVSLALANMGRGSKLENIDRTTEELALFLKACPAPLESHAIRTVAQTGTREQQTAVAVEVRKRIGELGTGLAAAPVYEALWNLEFQARPPSEHTALRALVSKDLEVLEKSADRRKLRWLEFLRSGYMNADNPERTDALNDEIVAKYPKSEQAKRELQERWRSGNPGPGLGADPEKLAAWKLKLRAKYAEWSRIWPEDSMLAWSLLGMLAEDPKTPPADVARLGTETVEKYRAAPTWWAHMPLEYSVADAFLKKNVNLDRVPALLEEGTARASERDDNMLADDRIPDNFAAAARSGAADRRLERFRMLLVYCSLTKNLERAKAIEADLAAMQLPEERVRGALLERRGQGAEVLGRKLDALAFYRSALRARTQPPKGADTLQENLDRLWKELGGSEAVFAVWMDKEPATAAAKSADASRWEKPKKPLPKFSVVDMEGKPWTLDGLAGKTVLINLWATWCGPCQAEHPEFQKLYEEMKARPDVQVISFNVDDEVAKVAPYMREKKYSFPVLLAREVVNKVVEGTVIPQNWFVARNGKLEAIQIGFGGESDWREKMVAKLEEIVKGK
jgi:thiol-disulfide isomerase/thioredoxin